MSVISSDTASETTWTRSLWHTGSMTTEKHELARLRVENARFIALLQVHGIEWRLSDPRQPSHPFRSLILLG